MNENKIDFKNSQIEDYITKLATKHLEKAYKEIMKMYLDL